MRIHYVITEGGVAPNIVPDKACAWYFVRALTREVIDDAGYGDNFMHGLGHGVGLEIHEAPALSQRGDGRIRPGMAVTVEPGVYLAGQGGVRIEDTLVVRPSTAELLTLTTKELVEV